MTKSFDEIYAPKAMSLDELFAAIQPLPLLPLSYPADPTVPLIHREFIGSFAVLSVASARCISRCFPSC